MLQDTLNVLRGQFLSLNRALSTVMELVSQGLLFDDESTLLDYASKLLISNHNFQFCTIHTIKDSRLYLVSATSTASLLDPKTITESEKNWVKTCKHLAQQLLDRDDGVLMKRQAGDANYYAMPINYRNETLAILTVNSPSFDDNHQKLITIYCNTLTSLLINSRNSQYLTQEVARRTEELESALKLADAGSKAKTQFLSNMSHEYLTPLNAITGMSTLLIDTKLNSEQREFVGNIESSAIQLQTLVQDMLNFSNADNGSFDFNSKTTNLPELMQGVFDSFVSSASAKGLEFELLLASDLPKLVFTDENQLHKILAMLVSNAIKFTSVGKVTIDAYCVELTSKEAFIRFSILDTGIGITEAEIKDIFNVLHQVDNSDSRRFQGAGIGLAICQRIASIFNSQVDVKSTPDEGSEFSLTLRLEISPDETNVWENTSADLERLSLTSDSASESQKLKSQLSVLLVEDNLINQKLAARLLEKLGCFVDIANDGADAVDMFARSPYDLIFMDCQMPIMDGFEATTKIREIESAKKTAGMRTPIIALTANCLPEDRARSFDAGMDEFLTKPILKEKLQTALIKWVSPSLG
ncbi:MAG: response regulator [Pseudomonadales bacterium]|nr:response regulator [Pseudomonadales bacterium]